MIKHWGHGHSLAGGFLVAREREGRPMSEIVRRAVNVYEGKPA